MPGREDAELVRWVSTGQYEKALGIGWDATGAEIARAHIRRLHRSAGSAAVRETLNRAKAALLEETPSRRANRYLSIDEPLMALEVLKKNLSIDATASEYHFIGYVLLQLGRYAESASYMEKAFALCAMPFHAIWLGQAYEHVNRREEALEMYLAAVAMRGSETEHRLAGNLCFHMGRFEVSLGHLCAAVVAGCNDAEVHHRVQVLRRRLRWRRLHSYVSRLFSKIRSMIRL
jgi:tetratricopeptide (TPR) repeat protein